MRILSIFIAMSFLLGVKNTSQPIIHSLEFVQKNDKIAILIERLYLSSKQLPTAVGSFYTIADVKEDLENWKHIYPNPTEYQLELINKIESMLIHVQYEKVDLSQASFTPTIEITSGMDYLFHPRNSHFQEDSLFFNVFRDRDFHTKYNERGDYFSIQINSSYWKYFYFSSKFGLRENWIGLLEGDHHFANSFHEIENNFNQHAYGTFRFGPLLLNSGRSRATLGLGNHGKLLLGNELPPLDVFRASVNFGKYFKFYNYMMPLNNISMGNLNESKLPKYLLAHRVSLDLPPYFRIAGSELMIINSYLKWNYLNPLIVYHQVTNADLVNILTSFDLEFVPHRNISGFLSIAIDEIDFYLIEQQGEVPRESRLAMGLQTGFKIYNPLGLDNSKLQFEYLSTDRWLYNYQVSDNSKDLTYTFVEKIEFPQTHYFYRHVGHYLGSNAEAIFVDFEWKNGKILINQINRGNSYILEYEKTWDESLPNIIENSTSIFFHYKNSFMSKKIELKSKIGYTWVNNYHHIQYEKYNYPEVWLSINYRLFFLTEI
ncbi:MAG: hypothetical protein H8E60_04915 [Candidatus Marinimicrobia bacterium]|nr:hypothetical protein [Candidatus Neomarinimicrobiota bacterium]